MFNFRDPEIETEISKDGQEILWEIWRKFSKTEKILKVKD